MPGMGASYEGTVIYASSSEAPAEAVAPSSSEAPAVSSSAAEPIASSASEMFAASSSSEAPVASSSEAPAAVTPSAEESSSVELSSLPMLNVTAPPSVVEESSSSEAAAMPSSSEAAASEASSSVAPVAAAAPATAAAKLPANLFGDSAIAAPGSKTDGFGYVGIWVKDPAACAGIDTASAADFAIITIGTYRTGPLASYGNFPALKDGKATLNAGGGAGSQTIALEQSSPDALTIDGTAMVRCTQ